MLLFRTHVELEMDDVADELATFPDDDILRFLEELDRVVGDVEFSRKARNLFDTIVTRFEGETK